MEPNAGIPMGKRKRKKKLATDPPTSEAQRRAMWAAKEGKSTLGIPKSVGEKFVGKGHDAGGLFRESDHPRDNSGKFGSGGKKKTAGERRGSMNTIKHGNTHSLHRERAKKEGVGSIPLRKRKDVLGGEGQHKGEDCAYDWSLNNVLGWDFSAFR